MLKKCIYLCNTYLSSTHSVKSLGTCQQTKPITLPLRDRPQQHIKKQRHHLADKGLSSQSYGFSSSHVWMWELDHKKRLRAKELKLLNCGFGEDSWEPLGLQGDQTCQSKEINPEYSLEGMMLKLKLQYFGHLTYWKRPWCWERLKAGGKVDNRGWDGWKGSPTCWTWVWANSER